jgi:hypothetical protein
MATGVRTAWKEGRRQRVEVSKGKEKEGRKEGRKEKERMAGNGVLEGQEGGREDEEGVWV